MTTRTSVARLWFEREGEESEEEAGGGDEGQRRPAVRRQVPQVEDGAEGRVVALCHADRRVVAVGVVRSRPSPAVADVLRRGRDACPPRQVLRPRTRERTTAPTRHLGRLFPLRSYTEKSDEVK